MDGTWMKFVCIWKKSTVKTGIREIPSVHLYFCCAAYRNILLYYFDKFNLDLWFKFWQSYVSINAVAEIYIIVFICDSEINIGLCNAMKFTGRYFYDSKISMYHWIMGEI